MLFRKLSSLQNILEHVLSYILSSMFFSIQTVLRMFAIFSPIKNVLDHAFAFYMQNVLKHVRSSTGVSWACSFLCKMFLSMFSSIKNVLEHVLCYSKCSWACSLLYMNNINMLSQVKCSWTYSLLCRMLFLSMSFPVHNDLEHVLSYAKCSWAYSLMKDALENVFFQYRMLLAMFIPIYAEFSCTSLYSKRFWFLKLKINV